MHKPTKKPSVKPFRNSSPPFGRKGNRMNKALLLSELCRDEGFKDKPYTCSAGKISIGIGRNLEDVGLSRDEILYLYRNDIVRVEAEALSVFPTFQDFSDSRQRALLNMLFNLGLPRFLGFKKMIAAIHQGDWARAASEALDSKAARQTGERYDRIAALLR